jgi:hypothetical protein
LERGVKMPTQKAYHLVVVSMGKEAKPQSGVLSAEQVTVHLNKLAADGWRVLSTTPMGFNADAVQLYFLLEKDLA